MKANLRRSHLANTHHLITRVSSALSLSNLNDIWKNNSNNDFLSISISSSKFQWLDVLINSFITNFRIKSTLLSSYHSKLLLIPAVYAELICFCDLNNQQCVFFLTKLLEQVNLNPSERIRILYILQCYNEAIFTSSLYIDHLEISPRRLTDLSKIPFSNSYGPHASLSFGHFAFLIESSFASKLFSMDKAGLCQGYRKEIVY